MEVEIFERIVEIDGKLIRAREETVRNQVEDYVTGERKHFDLEIEFPKSFKGKVMETMNRIPYGDTLTYGDIASRMETSAIAVGQACASNPVPVIVPCHRVVSRNGKGGYQYPGLKEKLLDLEASRTSSQGNQT